MSKDQEIIILENTLKLLRKGKYELSGEEALVFYSSFDYIIKKIQELKKPLAPVNVPAPMLQEPVKAKKKKD
jgi:hypothetical protein